MSEDQEKKPKAKLIKHRKPEEDKSKQDKKRVVVVKKRHNPPAAPKKRRVVTTTDQKPEVPVEEKKSTLETKEEKPQVIETAKVQAVEKSEDSRPVEKEERRPVQRSVAPRGDRSTAPPQRRYPRSDRPTGGRFPSRTSGPAERSGSSDRSGSSEPMPGRSRYPGSGQRYPQPQRPARPPREGGNFRSGPSQGGYRGGTQGGFRGPQSGGSRPNYQGGRPGTRPQGGAPRPGGRPGPGRPGGSSAGGSNATDQKKAPSKKFLKSKKGAKSYQKKREDHSEKAFSYNKKKSIRQTNPVPKSVDIMEVITVSELARKMNLKASDLIGKLMGMGMMVTINQQIDADTATLLAEEYGCEVKIVSLYDETLIASDEGEQDDVKERPAIVTVMGHVDHGKTKLLDAIRETNVVSGEHGGITQHIGAYSVTLPQGKLTFLDTPGHEAFTLMRARGAQITDIVILIVAANDGVMPQTIEAIHHAQEAKVPIIVAINKIDLPDANPDRVKQQLSEYNLISEDWGGSTLFVEISALKKQGIDELLETILLQSELLELDANYGCRAEGKVIEAKVDQGRGIVATVLIERGTLKIGDPFVAGIFPGKVRAMFNSYGEKLTEAPPSTPVEILGFNGVPSSGAPFQVTENDRMARQIGDKRQELRKVEDAKNVKKITLANLYDSIQEGEVQEFKVIIKGDVHGSVEALQTALEKLSTPEIRLNVIHAAAGAVIEGDVTFAAASSAIIIGFHVRPTAKAQLVAEQEKVEIRKYNIIYDAVEDIREAMEGMLSPELREEVAGTIEVRETFKVPKIGVIAGCYVTSGIVHRNSQVHLIRDGIQVFTGGLASLKRFKDDVKEVREGFECGLGLDKFTDIKVGDTIEVIEIKEIARKLSDTRRKEEKKGNNE